MANKLMQMQLDLDESETGYYENVANELLEQLEGMTAERDEWLTMCEQVGIPNIQSEYTQVPTLFDNIGWLIV